MNSVKLIGRITKKPEINYTPSQMAICKFTLAVDRHTKEGGADFIRVTAFNKQAENTARYTDKGSLVAVDGKIQTGSYKDKTGNMVYTMDVIAFAVEFLSKADVKPQEKPQPTQEQVDNLVEDVSNLFGFNATVDECPF